MISSISRILLPRINNKTNSKIYYNKNINDSIEINNSSEIVKVFKNNNQLRVSFKGKLNNPQIPAIQMKVKGVSLHQKTLSEDENNPSDYNVDKLAQSEWKDGKKLNYEIRNNSGYKKIYLIDPDFGEIGRVPDEVCSAISKMLEKNKNDFEFQLSNVIAGTNKGAATTGLRVNLICTSNDEKVKEKANKTFGFLLNSCDNANSNVMLYQEEASPKKVLERIFDVTKEKNGPKAAEDIREVIETISNEIDKSENKKILLIGHNVPDGDTIGCVLGMEAAIKATYPDKKVDASINDKIPGLFRNSLIGVENIKQADELNNDENYDLIILMDVPSPSRFSDVYKNYLQNAKNVIYIDHHPFKYSEWQDKKDNTGVDIEKIQNKKLSLILPEVPAAAQLVGVIADTSGMLGKLIENIPLAKQFTGAIVTGISTDSGHFLRNANLTPEDIEKPVEQRPNFLTEGMAKWFISKMGNNIDKKWVREHIVYDIPDVATNKGDKTSRQKMVEYSIDSKKEYPNIGLGIINVPYDKLYDIWESAKKADSEVTLADVQNSIKYSEVMGSIRDANKNSNVIKSKSKNKTARNHNSYYDNDKIAVLLIQDKKKGCVDENGQISDKNSIRMSFRSKQGTIYAEFLAGLFNGGGHSNAAGARIDVGFNTKFLIEIDGKVEKNSKKIFKALKDNYKINYNNNLSEIQKKQLLHKFDIIKDTPDGETLLNYISNITTQMRINNLH